MTTDSRRILVATTNSEKLGEISGILSGIFAQNPEAKATKFLSLLDLPPILEPEETGGTFMQNALLKAEYYHQKTGLNVICDDSGLCINALDGAPGVMSARFAKEGYFVAFDKINQLLNNESRDAHRDANFSCAICVCFDGDFFCFEGKVFGKISHSAVGESGFGYDPIFIPIGYTQTFAQMSADVKNSMSHRQEALKKMAKILHKILS